MTLRIILRTESCYGTIHVGMPPVSKFRTLDVDLPELEEALRSGGFSEDSYEVTELVGVELLNGSMAQRGESGAHKSCADELEAAAALPRPEADEGAVAAADLGQHEREGLRWIATHGNPYRSGDPARPWWTTLVELKRLGLVDADNNLTDAGRAALAAAQEGS